MDQTPLEIIESVDMNRILENGIKIKMVMRNEITFAVDTVEDLARVNKLMRNDFLIKNTLNKMKYQDLVIKKGKIL